MLEHIETIFRTASYLGPLLTGLAAVGIYLHTRNTNAKLDTAAIGIL